MADSIKTYRELRDQIAIELKNDPKIDWRECVDMFCEITGNELPTGVYACLCQKFDPERIAQRKRRYSSVQMHGKSW